MAEKKVGFRFNTLLLVLFVFSAFTIPPFLGEGSIRVDTALTRWHSQDALVIFSLRLPRIVFAFLVGGGLALVGTAFQALLRNDLATPYTLGVSSGGALGAVLALKLGLDVQLLGFSSVTLLSIAGSFLSLLIIYWVAQSRSGFAEYSLILAGVTISLTFSAFILFIHYLSDFTETFRMIRWLMGGLSVTGWTYPNTLLVLFLPITIFFIYHAQAFNILTMGSDLARTKGVDVPDLQKKSLILGSLLVGAAVSMAGPIGFVGLIVPHILRLLYGPDHRRLFWLSAVVGGAFLIWCDTLARSVIYPAEVPVGIITSLLGGPFFIYLLVKQKRSAG